MSILEIAIQTEEGVGKLADALDIAPNVISNWRKRGVPKPWTQVLEMRYGKTAVPAKAQPIEHRSQSARRTDIDRRDEDGATHLRRKSNGMDCQPAAIQEVPHA